MLHVYHVYHTAVTASASPTPMQALQPRALPAALRSRVCCATYHSTATLHTQRRAYNYRHPVQCQGKRQHLAVAVSHVHPQVQLGGRVVCSSTRSVAGISVQDVAGVQEGSVVTGVVTKLATFGAFVDIGGVRGLVHISQIKDGYIGDLAEVLSVGEVVTARVIKVEPYVGRVSLSMRALVGTTHEVQARTRPRDSPRKENDSVPEHIQVGSMVTGVVTQIDNQSGAWVDTHGVKAFLHISKIREEYLEDVAEVLSVGDEVTARVVKVEPATGDVALSMRPVEEVKVDMQEGTIVTGVVTKLAPFGAFVDIGGVRGLVHISQIKDGYIAAIEEELCVGEEVTAQVLSVEPQTGRVTLSMMALEEGTGAAEPLSQAQTGGHADSSSAGKHSRHKEEPLPVQVGDLATGVVTSIHKYGAFVDICGATGLLHISQISGARVEAVEDVLSVGEQVQVLVLHLDSDTGRVGFSTRVLEEHPGDMLTKRQAVFENAAAMAAQWRAQEKVKWAEVAEDGYLQGRDASAVLAALKEGDIVTGVVTKLLPIGALVDIGGVTGLVHISQIRKGRVKDVADALSLGDEVIARVLKVEANTARVALSIKAGLQAGDVVTGVVTEVQPGKAMVKVGGWQYVLHKPQFSGPCVESLEDVLNADEQVTAMVLRQRPDSKHVTLSTKLLERNPGDMLTNRQAVYAGAKEVAACWRKRQAMTAEIKQAAEEGRAPCVDMQVGDLVTGKVTRWLRFGALVAIDDGPEGLLHMDGLSGAPMEEVEAVGLDSVLPLGERIRALVVKMALTKGRVGLSTKALDKNPGDMLTNRQAVFDGAEEMAARWRERQTAEDAAEGRTPQQKAVKAPTRPLA